MYIYTYTYTCMFLDGAPPVEFPSKEDRVEQICTYTPTHTHVCF